MKIKKNLFRVKSFYLDLYLDLKQLVGTLLRAASAKNVT